VNRSSDRSIFVDFSALDFTRFAVTNAGFFGVEISVIFPTILPFSGVVPSVSEDHVRLQRPVGQNFLPNAF
jgi:hypothetical protein